MSIIKRKLDAEENVDKLNVPFTLTWDKAIPVS